MELAQQAMESQPSELALADTIGVATPWQVKAMLEKIRLIAGDTPIRCHFHNTRNTGIANAFAAIEAGADSIDASTGGIGGCPFAPAATGNIATEDLVYMMRNSGIEVNISLSKLLDTAKWLGEKMGFPFQACFPGPVIFLQQRWQPRLDFGTSKTIHINKG